jgi:hypothetical protein
MNVNVNRKFRKKKELWICWEIVRVIGLKTKKPLGFGDFSYIDGA